MLVYHLKLNSFIYFIFLFYIIARFVTYVLFQKNVSKETSSPNLTPLPLLILTTTMGYSLAAPSCQSGVECCINVTSACAPTHTNTLCPWCYVSSRSPLNCRMWWRLNHVTQSSLATFRLHKTCSGWRLWCCSFVEAPLVWHTVVEMHDTACGSLTCCSP